MANARAKTYRPYNKSVLIDNVSKLARIESQAFQKADLQIFAVSSSVEVLGVEPFSERR
jgi:hypothetical protein